MRSCLLICRHKAGVFPCIRDGVKANSSFGPAKVYQTLLAKAFPTGEADSVAAVAWPALTPPLHSATIMASKSVGIRQVGVRLSTRGEYGLRAIVALATRYGEGPLPLHELAESERIPPAYLEQLLGVLRRQRLVETVRGAHGGYRLAVPPHAIRVGEVVRALEGPIAVTDCALEEGAETPCDRGSTCLTRHLWLRVSNSIAEVLDSTTLADLIGRSPGSGLNQADCQESKSDAADPDLS